MNPYIGEIRIFPYSFAPQDWFDCNGQILAIQQYTTLFAVIGTQFGGNGTTNFQLPNLPALAAVGAGDGPGLSSYGVGETAGTPSVTLNLTQLPSHNHSMTGQRAAAGSAGEANLTATPGGNDLTQGFTRPSSSAGYSIVPAYTTAANATMAPQALALTGSGGPHENRQPFLALRFCICWSGIYPTSE